MIHERVDLPDALRDKTVTITMNSGSEFIGLTLIGTYPMIGFHEFRTPTEQVLMLRGTEIASIEIWPR